MAGSDLKITGGDKIQKNEWVKRRVKPPEKRHIPMICISVCNYL